MDTKQRNELNNQVDNGGNEKWRRNAKGKTGPDTPLDHTHRPGNSMQDSTQQGGSQQGGSPLGASMQDSLQGIDQMRSADRNSLPGPWRNESSHWSESGGAMQSQQSGGSGAQQSAADSHQRDMAQHSDAWGLLEETVGRRAEGGTNSVAPASAPASTRARGKRTPRAS